MTQRTAGTKIISAIMRERDYQDRKYGSLNERDITVEGWLLILEHEIQEAKEAWIKKGEPDCLCEILQVVTVGFACMQEHGIVERKDG